MIVVGLPRKGHTYIKLGLRGAGRIQSWQYMAEEELVVPVLLSLEVEELVVPVLLSLEEEEPSLARSASVGRGRPPSEEVQTADRKQKGIKAHCCDSILEIVG